MARSETTRPIQRGIAAGLVLVGALMLAYMVTHEGEPGLVPLLLVSGGIAWWIAARPRTVPPGR